MFLLCHANSRAAKLPCGKVNMDDHDMVILHDGLSLSEALVRYEYIREVKSVINTYPAQTFVLGQKRFSTRVTTLKWLHKKVGLKVNWTMLKALMEEDNDQAYQYLTSLETGDLSEERYYARVTKALSSSAWRTLNFLTSGKLPKISFKALTGGMYRDPFCKAIAKDEVALFKRMYKVSFTETVKASITPTHWVALLSPMIKEAVYCGNRGLINFLLKQGAEMPQLGNLFSHDMLRKSKVKNHLSYLKFLEDKGLVVDAKTFATLSTGSDFHYFWSWTFRDVPTLNYVLSKLDTKRDAKVLDEILYHVIERKDLASVKLVAQVHVPKAKDDFLNMCLRNKDKESLSTLIKYGCTPRPAHLKKILRAFSREDPLSTFQKEAYLILGEALIKNDALPKYTKKWFENAFTHLTKKIKPLILLDAFQVPVKFYGDELMVRAIAVRNGDVVRELAKRGIAKPSVEDVLVLVVSNKTKEYLSSIGYDVIIKEKDDG